MSALPVLSAKLVREGEANAGLLDLPERAVQFGTGAFLRGFVEHFIDGSNSAGKFNGRIVAVGSMGSGRDDLINSQDGLFTLLTEGIENGKPVREYRVISSLSRALSAADQWDSVLGLARDPQIDLIFSNTTEVGIRLEENDGPDLAPPKSFPAKLTRYLYERATAFDYGASKGMIVVPCELLERNGDTLRELVLETAAQWKLGVKFVGWIEKNVSFANTLVDRIVSGTPDAARMAEIESELGYRDELLTACEPYRLFAIEGDARVRARIAEISTDGAFFATSDVRPYRERKVRILNGGHTAMVAPALLAGCETVYEAMSDGQIGGFVRALMVDEIVPTVSAPDAAEFAREVLERFENPFIAHALIDITLHGTAKMRLRVIPSILEFAAREAKAPEGLTLGFAAHLVWMRGDIQRARAAKGQNVPRDDASERIAAAWAGGSGGVGVVVATLCADSELWGADLSAIPGFTTKVKENVESILGGGMRKALAAVNRESGQAVLS